ncbi:MAG TPA: hypothetical protein VFR37_25540 [Longimicrobium sp.]|nr:hypothetical protein [Longimicrobium sp.]
MISSICAVLLAACPPPDPCPAGGDTLRLHVGSAEVRGSIYPPHFARNRVYRGPEGSPPATSWTNELTLADSAGRRVMRWVTRGTRLSPAGDSVHWVLRQTYDANTLAPYAYANTSSDGAFTVLTIDGTRVRGSRRPAGDSAAVQQVDLTLDQPAFIASASDLVPLAVGLCEGLVMTAPVWGPAMSNAEVRVFSVPGRQRVRVEGAWVDSWKVEERVERDGRLVATWYLTEHSPYMVYAEVPLPNGQVQRMTGVSLDPD